MSLGNCIVLKGSVSFRLLLGGSDPYTGWGFTTESDAHIKEVLKVDICPYSPSSYHLRLSTNNPVGRAEFLNTLQTDPLFRKEPGILFGDSASVFAGATVGTCGFTFNYDLPDATMNIANVTVRDYLLSKAFPARTGAIGSRAISSQVSTEWQKATFDMSTQLRNPYAPDLPTNDDHDWVHSAIRDNAYVYVCNFFRMLAGKEQITTP